MTYDEKEQLKELIREVVLQSHSAIASSVSGFGDQINKLTKCQEKSLLDRLIFLWPLVLGILFVIGAFVKFDFNDKVVLERIHVVEAKTNVLEQTNTTLLSEMAIIKTDIGWIKNRLMK